MTRVRAFLRWPHLRDVALVLGLIALGEVELASGELYNGKPVWPGPVWLTAPSIVVLIAPLVLRRTRPLISVVGVMSVLSLYGLVLGAPEAATGFVLFIVTVFSGAAYADRWWAVALFAVTWATIHFFTDPSAEGITDKTWVFGLAAVAMLLGRAVRRRQGRIGTLEQEAELAELRHELEVDRAVTAERATIARELHDIVSHAVSVIVIQAQAGARALPASPDVASGALGAIEESARAAMVELRRLLALFAPDEAAAAVRPLASVDQLDELIGRWRAAGLDVDADIEDLTDLPAAIDLTAYRLVQESLTNTARHAPGARARVSVRVDDDTLVVRAADSGTRHSPGGGDSGGGSGRGLIGLRQRVELMGGQLVSLGPTEHGFDLHARLPLGQQ